MKIAKFLKRPRLVVLLIAVFIVFAYFVIQFFMGGKQRFMEGACSASAVGKTYIYDSKPSISGVASPNCVVNPVTDDKTFNELKINRDTLAKMTNCSIDNGDTENHSSITVGCGKSKTGSGADGIVNPKFDLTKCKMTSDGKYYDIYKDGSGNFTCITLPPSASNPIQATTAKPAAAVSSAQQQVAITQAQNALAQAQAALSAAKSS
jgi:hypothetical protein